jgi:hypothetical protein
LAAPAKCWCCCCWPPPPCPLCLAACLWEKESKSPWSRPALGTSAEREGTWQSVH